MGILDGKTALITGGARGQGRAHAVRSAQEGSDVILVDITDPVHTPPYRTASAEDMAETVRLVEQTGQKALALSGDVRSQSDLDSAVARGLESFGKIDILIANAGIWSFKPIWELDERTWDEMIDINLGGVYRSIRAVTPHMMDRESGSIVVISSVSGLEPAFGYAHYASAKHGLIGLMSTVALELGPYGIRANAICPGAVDTPMTDNQTVWDMVAGHEGGTRADRHEGGFHQGALKGRSFLAPEAIADTAVYLNSALAEHVTGVAIPVDAGHMILQGINMDPTR
jgi:SDR family mycofactocin-dependent oxidoreductase